jgi:hypothetical protein
VADAPRSRIHPTPGQVRVNQIPSRPQSSVPTRPPAGLHTSRNVSVRGLGSYVGLLTLDGTVTRADLTPSGSSRQTPSVGLGRPVWDADCWSWSPQVEQRLIDAVAAAAAGRAISYRDTLRINGSQLVTVDVAVAPLMRDGVPVALIASALDVAGAPRPIPGGLNHQPESHEQPVPGSTS